MAQVGFLGKSHTYDSHDVEEWHTHLSRSYAMTHSHTVCAKCQSAWWVTSEFAFVVTVWPLLAILFFRNYDTKLKLAVATLVCYPRAKMYKV